MIILVDKRKEIKKNLSVVEKRKNDKFFFFGLNFFTIFFLFLFKIFFPQKKVFLAIVSQDGFNLIFFWKYFLKKILKEGKIIYNFDIEKKLPKEILKEISSLSFGFKEGADFQIIDLIKHEAKINFKIIYQNKIVPFWCRGTTKKNFSEIYCFLASLSLAVLGGLNLVEISQTFKDFKIE